MREVSVAMTDRIYAHASNYRFGPFAALFLIFGIILGSSGISAAAPVQHPIWGKWSFDCHRATPNACIPPVVNYSDLPVSWRISAATAADIWSNVGTPFWFKRGEFDDTQRWYYAVDGLLLAPGEVRIVPSSMAPSVFGLGDFYVPAETRPYPEPNDSGKILAVLMVVNETYFNLYGLGDLQKVFVHELGHALGLDHNDVNGSVMRSDLSKAGSQPNQHDQDDVISLYGTMATSLLDRSSPSLLSPANGSSVENMVTLRWSQVSGSQGYYLQISKTRNFSFPLFNEKVSNADYQPPFTFGPGATYYWRVKAFNASWNSAWSATNTFAVTSPSCTDDASLDFESIYPSDVLSPGQAFTKVWRIKNTGTCPWDGPVRLNYIGGDQMGAPQFILAPTTNAGSIAEFPVQMIAPTSPGTHTGYWQMCRGFCVANSVFFGRLVTVQITVPDPNSTPPPSSGTAPEIEIVSVDYPSVVSPGQRFRPKVTVKVNQGQLLESRGDMLRNTDSNLYGAWPHVAVVGTVNAGQSYTFEFYENNPITAPSSEGTYQSHWQVWRSGNWAGPEVDIRFDVRGSAATRPNPPTLVSPSNWYVSQNGSTPALCASAPSGLQYYFQIYQSHDIPESGWITNSCWTPPALGYYGYQWHVKVKDLGSNLESDWSDTWHFEISSQEVIMHGILFSPSSPSAGIEVDGEPAVV